MGFQSGDVWEWLGGNRFSRGTGVVDVEEAAGMSVFKPDSDTVSKSFD
jgi:hypothetical protein